MRHNQNTNQLEFLLTDELPQASILNETTPVATQSVATPTPPIGGIVAKTVVGPRNRPTKDHWQRKNDFVITAPNDQQNEDTLTRILYSFVSSDPEQLTRSEQSQLAAFLGWADTKERSWLQPRVLTPEQKKLKREGVLPDNPYELLSNVYGEEIVNLSRSYAANTPYLPQSDWVRVWQALTKHGLSSASILLVGAGTGAAIGTAPKGLPTRFTAVEPDPIAGDILSRLYPETDLERCKFEQFQAKRNYQVVLAHVPDKNKADENLQSPYFALRPSLQEFAVLQGLNLVEQEGIVVTISPNDTWTNLDSKVGDVILTMGLPIFRAQLPASGQHLIVWHRTNTRPKLNTNLPTLACVSPSRSWEDILQSVKPIITLEGDDGESTIQTLAAPEGSRIGEVRILAGELYRVHAPDAMVKVVCQETDLEEIASVLTIKSKLDNFCKDPNTDTQLALRTYLEAHLAKYHQAHKSRSPLETTVYQSYFRDDPDYYRIIALRPTHDQWANALDNPELLHPTLQPQAPAPDAPLDEVAIYVRTQCGCLDIEEVAKLRHTTIEKSAEELLQTHLAYRDPANPQDLIYHVDYLSGINLYEKLDRAAIQAQTDATFLKNVEALKRAIPSRVKLENLRLDTRQRYYDTATLFRLFLSEKLKAPYKVQLKPDSTIKVEGTGAEDNVLCTETTTYSRAFELYANFRSARIVSETPLAEMTEEERQLYLAKKMNQRKFEAQTSRDFAKWCLKHHDLYITPKETLREHVEGKYNRTFNAAKKPQFDGAHLRFAGLSRCFKGLPFKAQKHQLNFTARMLFQGKGGCGHRVGTGKTITAALTLQAWRQAGYCQKALIAVPKKVVRKWAYEYLELFPQHRIIVIEEMAHHQRDAMLARVQFSDVQAVIVTHEVLGSIPNDAELERFYIEQEIEVSDRMLQAITTYNEENKDKRTRTQRTFEKLIARLRGQAAAAGRRAQFSQTPFTELGITALVVDEAQNFKRLLIQTQQEDVMGIATSASDRATDLFVKCRQLLDRNNDRGVLFLSGTPITNSITESYNMVRFLEPHSWQRQGMRNFDDWIAQFGLVLTKPQILVDGTFGIRTVLHGFVNLRALQRTFSQYWEILGRGEIEIEVPQENKLTVVIEPSNDQAEFFREIIKRAEDIRRREVKPAQDNWLKLTIDGRKAALDLRLLNDKRWFTSDNSKGKIGSVAKEVAKRYLEAQQKGETSNQLVFFDLYSLDALHEWALKQAENTGSPELQEQVKLIKEHRLNLHEELKRDLIHAGIPAERVAILNGSENASAKAKQTIADKYNRGEINILIGTTPAMGEGMDLQVYTTAVHHVDAPLRPDQLEQREGRAIRQGNTKFCVDVIRYVVRSSFDQYTYQLLTRKSNFIERFATESITDDETEDINQVQALDYEQIMAAANPDPRVKQFFTLKLKVAEALQLHTAASAEKRAAKYKAKELKKAIPFSQERIKTIQTEIQESNTALANYFGVDLQQGLPESIPLRLSYSEKQGNAQQEVVLTAEKDIQNYLNSILRIEGEDVISLRNTPEFQLNHLTFQLRRITLDDKEAEKLGKWSVRACVSTTGRNANRIIRCSQQAPSIAAALTANVRTQIRTLPERLTAAQQELEHTTKNIEAVERKIAATVTELAAARKSYLELAHAYLKIGNELGALDKKSLRSLRENNTALTEEEQESINQTND